MTSLFFLDTFKEFIVWDEDFVEIERLVVIKLLK